MSPARAAVSLMVAACLSAITALLIAGVGPWAGPTLFGITNDHGVHVGDVPVLVLWLVGMVGCGWLSRAPR